MTSRPNFCNRCGKPTATKCTGCHSVYYCGTDCQQKDWKEGGHKVLCKDLPKAIATAEPLIESTPRSSLNIQESFMGNHIPEEEVTQDMCYDAMEVKDDFPGKIRYIIKALKMFPLCTEAWGLLGSYYRYDLPEERRDYQKSVRMYDNAIQCARKIHPEWGEDRQERLEHIIEARPYYRALVGRAFALKKLGETEAAVKAAKQILRWNPHNGIKTVAGTWMLEIGDTENFSNFLRDMDIPGFSKGAALAYNDILFQYMRWKKGDVIEESVKRALYVALKSNVYVPDLLLQKEDLHEKKRECTDVDGPEGAQEYAEGAQSVWRTVPGALQWLERQKCDGMKVPKEMDLITILRKGPISLIRCKNTALDGTEEIVSTLRATQRYKRCVGTALPDFYWPPQMKRSHLPGKDILIFHYDNGADRVDHLKDHWRVTSHIDVEEVPFWKVLIRYAEEEEEEENAPDDDDEQSESDEHSGDGFGEFAY